MNDLHVTLEKYFGHRTFRTGQECLISAVISGHDVLAVMPTGSGKSLCYQLPAVMLPGTTLVVSPLIALMKDQVDELNRRGIRAAALHSMLSIDARRDVIALARAGQLRLLYVAPERFASDQFAALLEELRIARFVVDEAHCVSEWGHDFRPDYRRLRTAAAACRRSDGESGRPPMAAFTATATSEVREDVIALLDLRAPQIVVAGFDRPNIFLRVEHVDDDTDKHLQLPRLVSGRRALVYAATRRTAEDAARTLNASGIAAAAYHAGLEDDERTRVQEAFATGTMRVVCATNAFGMGIDRPDVDAVVHFALPGSIEAYYQEIGRAGRDGRFTTATLLFDHHDIFTREYLIDSPRRDKPGRSGPALDPVELAKRKAIEHKKLQHMIAYAHSTDCLRGAILRYFGDSAPVAPCGGCGNCEPQGRLDDYDLRVVRQILEGIAASGGRYGARRIACMLVGETRDLPPSLARAVAAGSLQHEDRGIVEQWIVALVSAGLLARSTDQYRTLSVTAAGREVLVGRRQAPAIPTVSRPRQRPTLAIKEVDRPWSEIDADFRVARRRLLGRYDRDYRRR
jgi:ATP-dependent DNA helicase RecQ